MAAIIRTSFEVEHWMAVNNFPSYAVSSFGRVRNARGHMLSPALVHGYPQVGLYHECKKTSLKVHRLVAMTFFPTSDLTLEVDHRDRDRRNNMVTNLRWVSHSTNSFNRGKFTGSSSRFRGVSWQKQTSKWRVFIQLDGEKKYIGLFANELDAARAYNGALVEFGLDEAIPNDLPEDEMDVEPEPVIPSLKPKRKRIVYVSEPDTESNAESGSDSCRCSMMTVPDPSGPPSAPADASEDA
jgi:hypothetical protein